MIPAKYWSPTKKLMVLGAMAGGKLVEDTATGNPLTFITDKAKPLKSLLVPFTPQQEGSGDPSPQNVRPIVPWNGLTVWNGGKNLVGDFVRGGFDDYGVPTSSGARLSSDYIECAGGAKYTLNASGAKALNCYIYSFDEKGQYRADYSGRQTLPYTYESPANAKYIRIMLRFQDNSEILLSDVSDIQLEVGQTATAYEPYHPITETDIPFASPVYGGTLDVVSGVLTVGIAFAEFDGSDDESWNVGAIDANKSRAFIALAGAPKSGYNRDIIGNYIKPTASAQSSPDLWTANINASGNILIGIDPSITTVEGWKAYLAEHPLQIVYPLATPQEFTLTPEQITALLGNNTIWSDADVSMTAVYLKNG